MNFAEMIRGKRKDEAARMEINALERAAMHATTQTPGWALIRKNFYRQIKASLRDMGKEVGVEGRQPLHAGWGAAMAAVDDFFEAIERQG